MTWFPPIAFFEISYMVLWEVCLRRERRQALDISSTIYFCILFHLAEFHKASQRENVTRLDFMITSRYCVVPSRHNVLDNTWQSTVEPSTSIQAWHALLFPFSLGLLSGTVMASLIFDEAQNGVIRWGESKVSSSI